MSAHNQEMHGTECLLCNGREKPLILCAACGSGFHAACLALSEEPTVGVLHVSVGIDMLHPR